MPNRGGHERVHGPFPHRNKWRIVFVGAARVRGKVNQRVESFETKAEALIAIDRARQLAGDRIVSQSIDAWVREKKAAGAWKAGTAVTNEYRLRAIFRLEEQDRALAGITDRIAAGLYRKRVAEEAPDTHHAELSLAKAFWVWCQLQGWVAHNPWLAIVPVGQKRSRPKDQLRVGEAKRLLRVALAEESKEGLAVALALLLGMRATEITSRTVRDVDDDGRLLWIPDAKTSAGVRQVAIPRVLQKRMVELVKDRTPTDPLWGFNRRRRPCDRHWLEHHTVRLCGVAKVPEVGPHALRGLHATIATVNGVASEVVARALGHEVKVARVTADHYIARGATESVRSAAVEQLLTDE